MRTSLLTTPNVVLLLIFISSHIVRANPKENKNNDKECLDLADFFYEIIVGVTSFPKQGDCSDQEELEIAASLEKEINSELSSLPGTIDTSNKICGNPINNHDRRLLSNETHDNILTIAPRNTEVASSYSSFLRYAKQRAGRSLLLRGRRGFIFAGGGRCRFCFFDSFDNRALNEERPSSPASKQENNDMFARREYNHRNMLYTSYWKPNSLMYPKVSDISLCERFRSTILNFGYNQQRASTSLLRGSLMWRNAKSTSLVEKGKNGRLWKDLVGPYVAGDSLGVQLDMNDAARAVRSENEKNEDDDELHKDRTLVNTPVKDGTIRFGLWNIDLPTYYTTGMLLDDPFFLFINGIKLDFKLLMSQPNVKRTKTHSREVIQGSSFAGIEWKIRRVTRFDKDWTLGSELDIRYWFEITAPLMILSHKNQLDLDFIIKPHAKARRYVFSHFGIVLNAAQCEVTGLENSPFEDFKSVVESRLFHKLGGHLARKFQEKEGHCLHEKIPVVNVHLVEKEDWRQSNPHCDQLINDTPVRSGGARTKK